MSHHCLICPISFSICPFVSWVSPPCVFPEGCPWSLPQCLTLPPHEETGLDGLRLEASLSPASSSPLLLLESAHSITPPFVWEGGGRSRSAVMGCPAQQPLPLPSSCHALALAWTFSYLLFFRALGLLGLPTPTPFTNAVQLLLTLKVRCPLTPLPQSHLLLSPPTPSHSQAGGGPKHPGTGFHPSASPWYQEEPCRTKECHHAS